MKKRFRWMAGRRLTDEDIVNAICSGDEARVNAAIHVLYSYKTYVTGFVWTDSQRDLLGFDQEFVNDLFQDTIMTFLKKVWDKGYYPTPHAGLKTYLYKISEYKYRSERKRTLLRLGHAHSFLQEEETEPITAEAVYLEQERYSIVEQLLDRIGKIGGVAGGELIRLFDFHFKSHSEIGLIYGISEAAAKQRYFRARQQLNSLLENYNGLVD